MGVTMSTTAPHYHRAEANGHALLKLAHLAPQRRLGLPKIAPQGLKVAPQSGLGLLEVGP